VEWVIHDLAGREVFHAVDRLPNSEVYRGFNDEDGTGTLHLSLEDEASEYVVPLAHVVKVYKEGENIFNGVMLDPSYQGNAGVVSVPLVGGSNKLGRSNVGTRSDGAGLPGHILGNQWRWEQVDEAEMAWRLIQHVEPTQAERDDGVPGTGIAVDLALWSEHTVKLRDREYPPGDVVWQRIVELSEVIAGFDFELRPVDRDDGIFWLFVPYDRMGQDKRRDVELHYGAGDENCTDFSNVPAGSQVIARSTWTGQVVEGEPVKAVTAEQPEALRAFGIYGNFESRPDISESNTLAEHAEGEVSTLAWPPDTFELTLAQDDGTGFQRDVEGGWRPAAGKFGTPPTIGPNPAKHRLWLGDIPRVIARRGRGLRYDGAARVVGVKFVELASGATQPVLTFAPAIQASGIVSYNSTFTTAAEE
jgi:hypothetical protein